MIFEAVPRQSATFGDRSKILDGDHVPRNHAFECRFLIGIMRSNESVSGSTFREPAVRNKTLLAALDVPLHSTVLNERGPVPFYPWRGKFEPEVSR